MNQLADYLLTLPDELFLHIVGFLNFRYNDLRLHPELDQLISTHEQYIKNQLRIKHKRFIDFYRNFVHSYYYTIMHDSLKNCATNTIFIENCFNLYKGCTEYVNDYEIIMFLNSTDYYCGSNKQITKL